jgi:hypothetical protein
MADINKMDRTWLCSVVFMDIVNYSSQSVDTQMKWKQRFNGYLMEAIQNVPESERRRGDLFPRRPGSGHVRRAPTL